MSLATLADLSLVVFGLGWTALTVGLVLFKVFVLIAKVAELEEWASAVSDELEAQEQRRGKAVA
jgi:hypothetical protein